MTEHHATSVSLREKYHKKKKQGRKYLLRGIFFLAGCVILAQVLRNFTYTFISIIAETITIAGWVALWRPIEIYLYELPEIRAEIRHAKMEETHSLTQPV